MNLKDVLAHEHNTIPRRKRTRREAIILMDHTAEEAINANGSKSHEDEVIIVGNVVVDGSEKADEYCSDKADESEREKERQRKRKGKMVAVDDNHSPTSTPNIPPGEKKLMGDAIRAGGGRRRPPHATTTATATTTTKLTLNPNRFWAGLGHDGTSTSSAGSEMCTSLDGIAVVDERLRQFLKGLGATTPVRVYGKKMWPSDRDTYQNRFQMSCKSWHDTEGVFPLDVILTQAEKKAILPKPKEEYEYDNDGKKKKNKESHGLEVMAYDRTGEPYNLKLSYASSNTSYRLITNWGNFLRKRNLVERDETDVKNNNKKKKGIKVVEKPENVDTEKAKKIVDEAMIDVWVFRSPKLPVGKDEHEDGRLGVVMVHYFKGEAPHADAGFNAHEELLQARPAPAVKNGKDKDQQEAASSSSSSSSSSSHEEKQKQVIIMEDLPAKEEEEEPNGDAAAVMEIAAAVAAVAVAGEDEAAAGVVQPPHVVEEVVEVAEAALLQEEPNGDAVVLQLPPWEIAEVPRDLPPGVTLDVYWASEILLDIARERPTVRRALL
uniref:TF-B3 domain-containing protein n=1 Tax=Leersia perrieri TaxID=77586 RepID=A0A0D9WE79_9ORYZ